MNTRGNNLSSTVTSLVFYFPTPRHTWLRHNTPPTPSYSIDQTNIDASLLCLPVFLASCQRLLVLAGTTYTTRM